MRVCIVPCATGIRTELQFQFGKIPNILIPLENRLFFEYIYNSLNEHIDYFIIVTAPNFVNIIYNNLSMFDDKLFIVPCANTADLLTTIKYGYNFVYNKFGISDFELIVNFGDTFIECNTYNFQKDFLFYSKVNDNTEWTSFSVIDGKIRNIIDKEEIDIDVNSMVTIFCGLFFFKNTKTLTKLWKYSNDVYGEFYRVVYEYSENHEIDFIEADKWIDVGHLYEYFKSKKSVASRYFNMIEIDEKRGILIKKSLNEKKLSQEISWYLKLPKSIQYIFPRVYDYSLDENNIYLKMEYLPYPTLHELYVFAELPLYVWKNIISNLLFLLNELSNCKVQVSSTNYSNSINDMYINKTLVRIDMLQKNNDILYNLYMTPLTINGIVYKQAEYYVRNLNKVFELSGIYESNEFSIIHGDYCASNILCDIKYNILRLVDPRGNFGNYDIYGDSLYDIAKLLHSFDGKYDFIISDKFRLNFSNDIINYWFITSKKHNNIDKLLFTALVDKYHDSFYKAKLIEGILFISMLPLHEDNINRQRLMLCRGVELLDYAFKYYSF